jgi:hypothetical protein
MSKCQGCGKAYKVDVMIPNDIWERIKPGGKPVGAGLLCGLCIMERMERTLDYSAYKLVEVD